MSVDQLTLLKDIQRIYKKAIKKINTSIKDNLPQTNQIYMLSLMSNSLIKIRKELKDGKGLTKLSDKELTKLMAQVGTKSKRKYEKKEPETIECKSEHKSGHQEVDGLGENTHQKVGAGPKVANIEDKKCESVVNSVHIVDNV